MYYVHCIVHRRQKQAFTYVYISNELNVIVIKDIKIKETLRAIKVP